MTLLRLPIIPRGLVGGLLLIAPMAVGCSDGGTTGKDPEETVEDDTGEGGGTGTLWRPAGEGVAYFADGAEDNSLFHLELTRCIDPADGEAYYGWVSQAGADPLSVGEITVDGDIVLFEADIGVNAIIEGYDTFEAWANADGAQGSGEQLWTGQVDSVVYDVVQTLVIASSDTPDGEGSLRSVETAVEALRLHAQEVVDAGGELEALQEDAEGIANAIRGEEEDLDGDRNTVVWGDLLPILGDSGYISLILADLVEASDRVEPGDPIKDYANYAYDCTQQIEAHAEQAALDAEVATAAAADSTAEARLEEVVTSLDYALEGLDADESGTVDLLTEGTIECALLYVSQMTQMTVTTP